MNNSGQTLGLSILSFLVLLIIGFSIINLLAPEVTDARTNLNCDNPDLISSGTKVMCLFVDVTVVYWIIGILSVAIASITARLLL